MIAVFFTKLLDKVASRDRIRANIFIAFSTAEISSQESVFPIVSAASIPNIACRFFYCNSIESTSGCVSQFCITTYTCGGTMFGFPTSGDMHPAYKHSASLKHVLV